jgi:hypothetical protein
VDHLDNESESTLTEDQLRRNLEALSRIVADLVDDVDDAVVTLACLDAKLAALAAGDYAEL